MDKNNLIKDILSSELILFDIGAMGGTNELKNLAAITHVHAFEPNLVEAQRLKNIRSTESFLKYNIHPFALANKEGTLELNIANKPSMSSLLTPDMENYHLHFGMMKSFNDWKTNIEVKQKIAVHAETLDLFTVRNNIEQIDFLKLDTQGTELSVLEGAQRLLENNSIRLIKTEVSFVPVYKNQCLFSDLDIFLRKHNMIFVDCLFYENTIYETPKQKNKAAMADDTRFSAGGDAIYIIDIAKTHESSRNETAIKTGLMLADLNYKSLAFEYLHRWGKLKEQTAIDLIGLVWKKTFKEKMKKMVKYWVPPAVLKFIK